MNFLNRFTSGDLTFSQEEKKLVMDKTVSVSTDPSDEKVKVDHLDSNNQLEKDVLQVQKSERDIRGTVALPLFRFEEKQKNEIINILYQISEFASTELKNNIGGIYTPLFTYVDVKEKKDIKYLVDLVVSRNKEIFNTSNKDFEIEIITCYFEKKLRIKFDIPEDKAIDEKVEIDYASAKTSILKALKKLYNSIVEHIDLKKTGVEKDVEIEFKESAGPDDYGTGYSIFLKYNKLIDYMNQKRGREDYGIFEAVLDEDFKKSLESSENTHINKEQNSIINDFTKSTEAIADGMVESDGDQASEEDGSGNETGDDGGDNQDSTDGADDMGDDGDMSMDDGMDGEGDEDDSSGNDDSDSSGDSSDSDSGSKNEPTVSGKNPFADVNSKEKISSELSELKSQIDRTLIKLRPFKSNRVVKRLEELDGFVKDALQNSFIVPIQDSLIRYSLYLSQYEDLIMLLEKYFELFQNKKSN